MTAEATTTLGATTPPSEVVVNSRVAAAMIGITMNNLRQYVWRKEIKPTGRAGRLSLFSLSDVQRLTERRVRAAAMPVTTQ